MKNLYAQAIEKQNGKKEAEPSIFERPELARGEKMDAAEYAKLRRAHFTGKLLLGASVRQEKNKQGGRAPDLKKALEEKDVEIRDLDKKGEALAKTRQEFSKKVEGFREAEKDTGRILENFRGNERKLLFAALDHSINPESENGQDGKKKATPEEQEKFPSILAKFDERASSEKAPQRENRSAGNQAASHLSAYLYLKQERVFDAENQLNGTREQGLRRETAVRVAERSLTDFLDTNPAAAVEITSIGAEKSWGDSQKLRAIHKVLESTEDSKKKKTLADAVGAFEAHALEEPEAQQKLAQSERHFQKEQEALARARELGSTEKLIEQIPSAERLA